MQPVSRWVPKEMLPVGAKPMIQFVLEEAVSVDPAEVVVVVSPEKTVLQNFLQDLDRLDSPASELNVTVAHQQRPLGLADALREGRSASGTPEGPVLSLLPDNLYFEDGEPTPAARLVSSFDGEVDSLHLLHPVRPSELSEYGYVGTPSIEEKAPGRYRMTGVPEKGDETTSDHRDPVLRSPGREIFGPAFFDVLDDIEGRLREDGRELDDVPVIREMIDRDLRVEAVQFDDRIYDVGHPAGMAGAWRAFEDA